LLLFYVTINRTRISNNQIKKAKKKEELNYSSRRIVKRFNTVYINNYENRSSRHISNRVAGTNIEAGLASSDPKALKSSSLFLQFYKMISNTYMSLTITFH